MNKSKKNIFLCYAKEDIVFANKLYNDLTNTRLDIWMDNKKLLPGQNWELEIFNAIKKSDYTIILLSHNSVSKKGFIQKEVKIALENLDYYPERSTVIIPVRIDDCIVDSPKLQKTQWIDLFPPKNYREGISKILKTLGIDKINLRMRDSELAFILSEKDLIEFIRKSNFFDAKYNPKGKGSTSKFILKRIRQDEVVIDEHTGLMWQRGGSHDLTEYLEIKKIGKSYKVEEIPERCESVNINAENFLLKLNKKGFAGFNDWRIPTVEEALSLVKKRKNKNELYLSPKFDKVQWVIFTADINEDYGRNWKVNFRIGSVYSSKYNFTVFLKAVRTV